MVGAIGGVDEGATGIRVVSSGTGAITVSNAGSGETGSRAIRIVSTGALSGATEGISATHTGDGAISITSSNSVTGQAGDAISATTAGGNISIIGAHTVTGTGGRGVFADSDGGNISIRGVGETGGVQGSAGHGIYADARGGSGGNINIGGSGNNALGTITGGGNGNSGINAQTSGAGRSITIDASGGTVSGTASGISAINAGSGTTSITAASVSATSGNGIATATTAGATIIVTAGGTVSGNTAAILTTVPLGDVTATPADSITIMGTVTGGNISTLTGADSVTLAAGSTTTGITIDLGEGDDTLNLASATFGTLDGGVGADTLRITGTDVTSDIFSAATVTDIETLVFAVAGEFSVTGTVIGLANNIVATGTTLDLAEGSSFSGDLANSGILTVAGSGFGSATITGDLVLNADGSLTLDTAGTGNDNDLLMVTGAVTLGGTLVLRQTTMPAGTVTLIDGGTALSGDFASSNEMSTEGLVSGLLVRQELVQDTTNFDLQLVTTVLTLESDPAFPTGCTVSPTSPLADGGALVCISATPITEAIATTVDGVTIIIGQSATQTSIMVASGDALSATTASGSTGNISINSVDGTISGGANGIVASNPPVPVASASLPPRSPAQSIAVSMPNSPA